MSAERWAIYYAPPADHPLWATALRQPLPVGEVALFYQPAPDQAFRLVERLGFGG